MPDQHTKYLIIGAGIHGLSTAWQLAKQLRASGRGSGADVLVVDKTDIGAGASGVACGVIRNNYFQPAMRELMAHSVDLWESDPAAFAYHPVGYLQIAPEAMHADVAQIHREQHAIGYESELIEGEADCRRYLEAMFADWQAPGISVVLHEKRGGYANNLASLRGLADEARAEGVTIRAGITVTGVELAGGAVAAVDTSAGRIGCEQLVVAAGPWVRDFWRMLELPSSISVRTPDGTVHSDVPMWTYWALQEGTLEVDPHEFTDNRGELPPVVHVDSAEPLYDDVDGSLITDQMWGIYYKPDFSFGGVQGGAAPQRLERAADGVAVDPYGPASPEFAVGEDFVRMWTSALAHCHKRFEGKRSVYRREPSGGIGAFTPDSFPVFDTFRENAYVIADANHGYKMLGVGALVAEELLGRSSALLEPFRFARYGTGELHPTSHSPFPWS
ncbi:glycine/D-amino acid oxidase-like deaminating enzyme [Tamaricihabitans halophyticus]|uniref:Glycine/D-amino acid oxidase-like deaminating enzyme n=1 Tax=Tamaricihabitans halophyticus TaxID=1262583 RepID=A0A4R2Q7A8_9PSEU|nr:FAD-binding oxidoreductase [Tamaricihabitans halophyticus]TCP43894.1 glycine/D-amino acid oxidase-like deaminating enzyme [Tamaricihabitans halophyticus]